MKQVMIFITGLTTLCLYSCSSAQNQGSSSLDVRSFSQALKASPDAVVLDVRTPEEFEKGHLKDAVNFNWKEAAFSDRVARMDQDAPVFVYCLSGGRSAAAAKKMREMGFRQVYEMEGGILKWKAAGLPLQTDGPLPAASGMTYAQFQAAISSDKKVLVDFYAPWCGPCKKMEPFLHEIAAAQADALQLVRIDIDANPELAQALKIEELPLLHLYQDNKLVWSHKGFIDKKEIITHLK